MNKKKFVTTVLASVMLSAGIGAVFSGAQRANIVQAARSNYVAVRGKKRVRLYRANGRRANAYAYPGKKYDYWAQGRIKVGRKYYSAYRLAANRYLLAKDAARVVLGRHHSRYQQARIVLPRGYTRSRLLAAYRGHPSNAFIKASMTGMKKNRFLYSESGRDDAIIVDPAHLSNDQSYELAAFSLRIINGARRQLKLPAWRYSESTQQLARDIAQEYTNHGRSIQNGEHYIAGIVRACQKNGLNLNDNYVEDLAGFRQNVSRMSMTELKSAVYFGLKQMIFGYAGSSERGASVRSNYREWEHAGDLFNTQGSRHDGDFDYYGFSVSKTGNNYSLHYIGVPSFIVNSAQYNRSFRP